MFFVVPVTSGKRQAHHQDLAARGVKNQKGGPHFQHKVLDACSNGGGPNVK